MRNIDCLNIFDLITVIYRISVIDTRKIVKGIVEFIFYLVSWYYTLCYPLKVSVFLKKWYNLLNNILEILRSKQIFVDSLKT